MTAPLVYRALGIVEPDAPSLGEHASLPVGIYIACDCRYDTHSGRVRRDCAECHGTGSVMQHCAVCREPLVGRAIELAPSMPLGAPSEYACWWHCASLLVSGDDSEEASAALHRALGEQRRAS